MYFMTLLNQDPQIDQTYISQTQQSPILVEDSPPPPQIETIFVKKSARGVNFTQEEDKLLVSAWLNTNIDVIQETNQKRAQLWDKISQYFN